MNPGGEPERDDTGLPPVDIEIPDDARELDRDVQAYYRERRAERRLQRRTRLHGSLARDGIVLPLLACCLILALITGTLLTVFTATSDQGLLGAPGTGGRSTGAARPPAPGASASRQNAARPAAASSASGTPRASSASGTPPASSAQPTRPAGRVLTPAASPLPDGVLTVSDGSKPVDLTRLRRALLVLVPPDCRCTAVVAGLAKLAAGEHATTYLVSGAADAASVSRLAGQLRSRFGPGVRAAVDNRNMLGSYWHGLTAVLVGPDRTVYAAGNLTAGDSLATLRPAPTG